MSVLIKGMYMPDCCLDCDFRTTIDGLDFCRRLKHKINRHPNARQSNCPLVEIPTPHGRLIDADGLLALINKEYLKECEGCEDGCCAEDRINEIISAIENAPTIIEADVSE